MIHPGFQGGFRPGVGPRLRFDSRFRGQMFDRRFDPRFRGGMFNRHFVPRFDPRFRGGRFDPRLRRGF
jgi:hypothetical protein